MTARGRLRRPLPALLIVLCMCTHAEEQPLRLIAEAEDFTVVSGDWQVVPFGRNYFASTFAITFLSRMACLGAPAQIAAGKEAVATQTVTVPRAGEYALLVRFEQPYNFSVEFTVEVEQPGAAVQRQLCGRLEDPKICRSPRASRRP